MRGLISKKAAIDALDEIHHALWEIDIPSPTVPEYIEHHESVKKVMKVVLEKREELKNLPSRKKEKWITDKYGCVVCSECKWDAPKIIAGCLANRHLESDKSDYCWHCGSDMRSTEKE